MSIATKLTTIAENTPKVYQAGQNSMIDHSKVIEKSVTRNSFVSLNDVSEIPHEVGVKVESRNLFDISKAVTISANNMVEVNGDSVTIRLSSAGKAYGFKVPNNGEIEVGSTYTLSVGDVSEHESGYGFRFYYKDGTYEQTTRVPKTVTVEKEVKDILFYVGFYNVVFQNDVVVKQPQIELGSTATPYTEYVEDITQVEVKQYGKNLFDGVLEFGIINANTGGNIDNNSYIRGKNYIPVVEGVNYIFSVDYDGSGTVFVYEYNENYSYLLNTNLTFFVGNSYTPSKGTKYIRIRPGWSITTLDVNIQMEIGEYSTPYEPHQEHIFYPSADGTVEGVKSISTSMNIMADKAVDISVDYWKSYGMNEFMNRFQHYGVIIATSYMYAGAGWTDITFQPTQNIVCTRALNSGIFRNSQITDLRGILEKQNVSLDTSLSTGLSEMCYYAQVTYMPLINASNSTNCNSMFYQCSSLVEVDGIVSNANATWTNAFTNCKNLVHIIFSGAIGNNIDFHYSTLLDLESLLSILTTLSKDSTLASGKTVTLATEHQEKIESDSACAEQLALAVEAGWTVKFE